MVVYSTTRNPRKAGNRQGTGPDHPKRREIPRRRTPTRMRVWEEHAKECVEKVRQRTTTTHGDKQKRVGVHVHAQCAAEVRRWTVTTHGDKRQTTGRSPNEASAARGVLQACLCLQVVEGARSVADVDVHRRVDEQRRVRVAQPDRRRRAADRLVGQYHAAVKSCHVIHNAMSCRVMKCNAM